MTIKMSEEFKLPVKKTPGGVLPYLKDCNDLVIFIGDEAHVKAAVLAINAYDANQLEIAELKLALRQNDDEIKNSEAVRASIAALADARTNGLANENDELKAMVNALRDGYKEAIVCMEGEWGEETCTEELKILSLSPAQCLASVKATAIKDAIFNSEKVEFEGSHYVGTYVSLDDLEVNIKQLGE